MDYLLSKYYNNRIVSNNYNLDVAYTNLNNSLRSIVDSFMSIISVNLVDAVVYFAIYGSNLQSDVTTCILRVIDVMDQTEINSLITRLNLMGLNVIDQNILTQLIDISTNNANQTNNVSFISNLLDTNAISLTNSITGDQESIIIKNNKFIFEKPINVKYHGDVAYKKDLVDIQKYLYNLTRKLDFIIHQN